MNKKIFLTPVVTGLALGMLITTPAFAAETNATTSTPATVLAESSTKDHNVASYLGKTVTKVDFVGADNYEFDEKKLRSLIKVVPGTKLEIAPFAEDLKNIYEQGYVYDIRPTFKEVPEGVQITYTLIPNPRYTGMEITGNTVYTDDQLSKIFDYQEGQVLNVKDLSKKAMAVEAAYHKDGYIRAQVADAQVLPNGKLQLKIIEGNVEGFKIKGNAKTKDYVILREMRFKAGTPFNAKLAKRSMERIYNLGFFEDVNIRLIPGQELGGVEVEIDVVESNTGSFGIGAGYSDDDGFIGMLSLADKNFRGTGDSLSSSFSFGLGDDDDDDDDYDDNNSFNVSYTKPWLDDKETTLTATVYRTTSSATDYDIDGDEIANYYKKSIGEEVTLSRADGEYIRNYITLKNRDDSYEGEDDDYDTQYYESSSDDTYGNTAAERIAQNFGVTRSITFKRILDSRNNYASPSEGKRITYSVEGAGFGGDFEFMKYSAEYRYYYTFGGSKNVLAVDLAVGYADGDLPLSQRFSVGGSNTLRGYETNQFRGESMLRGTVEYRVPVIKRVQVVPFVDYGYAWDHIIYNQDDFDLSLMKLGYGLGLRVTTPMGPLRLDYGIGEDDSKFHFSFGTQF
jgi:outer membrane protein insertion porin family